VILAAQSLRDQRVRKTLNKTNGRIGKCIRPALEIVGLMPAGGANEVPDRSNRERANYLERFT
jgi:hypothetical protein